MIPDAAALDALADIAVAAGSVLLEFRGGPLRTEVKADGSPVTAADHAANAIIIRLLAAQHPDIPIISEESARDDAGAHLSHALLLVDPLDGTKEFIAGRDEFAVNIALVENGEAIAGVICCPALGVLYAGSARQTARRMTIKDGKLGDAEPIKAAPAADSLRIITSRSHLNAETSAFIGRYSVGALRQAGSSLKFCLVAAGEADLYPRLDQTMEWDTAAGDAILRAAGGSVLTLDGQPLRYNKRVRPGHRPFSNPSFVAAGAFDPFDPRLLKHGA